MWAPDKMAAFRDMKMLDLRSERPECCLKIGVPYLCQQSNGWSMFGGPLNWWNWYAIVTGYNGAGGYWIKKELRWASNGETHSYDILSLSYEESRKLEEDIARLEIEENRMPHTHIPKEAAQ